MTISTFSAMSNGLQKPQQYMKLPGTNEATSIWHSHWLSAGRPATGVASAAGVAGEALSSTSALIAGQVAVWDPTSGEQRLARFGAATGNISTLLLCDRLWQNSGLTVTTTTSQTVNSVAFPARDRSGSTNGEDIWFGIEVMTATTNASPITNCTAVYTNDANVGSKTATMASFPATAAAGTLVPFEFSAGDNGVRSIQSITLGTSLVTGTINLVAFRILAWLGMSLANLDYALDATTGPFTKLYNGSVPFFVTWPNAATTYIVGGQVMTSQG